jgi:hypothetical protein
MEKKWMHGMREKGINNMEWIDREEWRTKIKLKLHSKTDVQTSRLCTQIKININ